jgi:hypothetical protein
LSTGEAGGEGANAARSFVIIFRSMNERVEVHRLGGLTSFATFDVLPPRPGRISVFVKADSFIRNRTLNLSSLSYSFFAGTLVNALTKEND